MAFQVDINGNITLIQGDSGELCISGLPTDKNYTAFFAIQNADRKAIGEEISVSTNGKSSVIFALNGGLTDLLTVKKNDDTAEYYYGIKICDESGELEDTLLLGDSQMGDVNTITVYPKKVEGTV